MKRYASIHVGTRLAATHGWGVMLEQEGGRELVCMGYTRDEAERLAGKLNSAKEKKIMKRVLPILALAIFVLSGCAMTKPLKGGKATTKAAGIEQNILQSDNPSQASRQEQETVKTRSYTLPTGSRIEETRVRENEKGFPVTNIQTVVVSAATPVVEREETRAKTELGAAQKDTARELGAKLASLKGVVWVGVAMFLFGLASLFYPPLRAIIGSVTTSAAILAGGVALMILPTVVVGNELLIMGGVALLVGGWFFAHRHGKLQGFVDANKNGIDDRLEQPAKGSGL